MAKILDRNLTMRTMRVALALVVLSAVWCISACTGGSDSHQTVTLSGADGQEIAKGTLSAMLAKASETSGLDIVLPGYMPPNSYVQGIALGDGSGSTESVKALIDIHVPTGEYFLEEFKGAYTGEQSAPVEGTIQVHVTWQPAPDLSAPGKTVYVIPNSSAILANARKATGYAIVGVQRSYTIEASAPRAYDAAVVDLPKMVKSLPMD